MKFYHTACPRNCYSTCSFLVGVEDGKVKKIEPQPLNKATPEGICLKGLAYVERANSASRILYPLQKVNGEFKRISWENALEIISNKITHYKEKYGSHSILFYASSGMSGLLNGVSYNFWKMVGGTTSTYGNLCWPAGLEATRLVLGDNKHNAPWDLENAKLIILWGKNPAESNIQEMIPIEKAQEKGAKLIVIDPRRTASCERADMLVQPKPGTDAALALGIARILINSGNINKEFIKEYVSGFEEFSNSLEKYNTEYVSKVTGVPENSIETLAELIGSISPMTIIPGYGMQRYSNGGQATRCLLSLQVLTGNIGKPGACWHYANLQSYVFDKVKEPMSYYPDKENDKPFRRTLSMAKLGEDMLAQQSPQLKMVWVERGNPLTQNPDSKKVKEAFDKLEFKVVVEQFMTDTAIDADIILPAKNMFEQSDIIGSYWNPYVQLKPKVVEPAGEVKPETEIYRDLAHKLGFDKSEIVKNIPEPNDLAIEELLKSYLIDFPEIKWEDLQKGPVLANSYEEIAFADMKFDTPSGKIELYSKLARERWDVNELPDYEPLVEGLENKNEKFPLSLMSPNTKNRIHSQFGNLEVIKHLAGEPVATVSFTDAEKRGIKEGDQIRVFNDRGEVFIKAKLDYSIRPGCVVITNGFWTQEGANPNMLSLGRETDMGHGTAFHDNMVEVEKIS